MIWWVKIWLLINIREINLYKVIIKKLKCLCFLKKKFNFIEKNISYIFLERIEEGEKIVFGFSVFEIFIIRM